MRLFALGPPAWDCLGVPKWEASWPELLGVPISPRVKREMKGEIEGIYLFFIGSLEARGWGWGGMQSEMI